MNKDEIPALLYALNASLKAVREYEATLPDDLVIYDPAKSEETTNSEMVANTIAAICDHICYDMACSRKPHQLDSNR